ncbi:hypothetical protein ABZP36_000703 [Zizania latifolia]
MQHLGLPFLFFCERILLYSLSPNKEHGCLVRAKGELGSLRKVQMIRISDRPDFPARFLFSPVLRWWIEQLDEFFTDGLMLFSVPIVLSVVHLKNLPFRC